MQSFLSLNNRLKREFDKVYTTRTLTVIEPLAKKYDIGIRQSKKCRFCRRKRPDVKFSNVSHAPPMMMGNRSIVDSRECDSCNHLFGKKLEDSFAKYLLPYRPLMRIKGRSGFAAYKDQTQRITAESVNHVSVDLADDATLSRPIVDGEEKLAFSLRRQPYVPIAIHKTLVKIAISFMKERDHAKFPGLKNWILEENHSVRYGVCEEVLEWQFGGPANPDKFSILVAKARVKYRKTHCRYMLVLRFSNFQYQIPIMDERWCANVKPARKFIYAPILIGDSYLSEYGDEFTFEFKRLNTLDAVRGEEVELVFSCK
jgi:hypothetical protein